MAFINKRIIFIGLALVVVGVVIVGLVIVTDTYQGYSGAGVSGIPAAIAMMFGFAISAVGILAMVYGCLSPYFFKWFS